VPTINQLVRQVRVKVKYKTSSPALPSVRSDAEFVLAVYHTDPKKPNSALRKALVFVGQWDRGYNLYSGIRSNLQELDRVSRAVVVKDMPGGRYQRCSRER